ncbi:DUF2057 family protein [Vibrio mexicanus]|uniref:DUF2057 family protein n=1 Tax=Vibrio mexicanus TaxID=1004326 RepID=UPI00063C5DD6|nr:DUF2057 family protein [Vibrio mexicanus]
MKKIKALSLLSALTLSTFAFADVTIKVPDTIEILNANGEKASLDGGFFSATKDLTLPDGENQIVFRYKPYFDRGDDRQTYESYAVITKFNAADTELTFELPQYRNQKEAERDIKNFEWALVDQNGDAIEVKKDNLIKDGMQIGRDFPQEVREYNRAGGVAAVAIAGTAMPVTLPAIKDQPKGEATASASAAEEMLHFWYEKADAETKARFKAFVNQQ